MDGSRRFHRGAFRCHGWPLLAPSCAAVLLAFAIDPTDPGVVPDALASADGNPPAAQLPYAEHPVMNNSYECCGWLTNESSEFYETAFAWQFDGCTAEGAGAFAQRLVLPRKGTICCALFDFTMARGEPSQPADHQASTTRPDGNRSARYGNQWALSASPSSSILTTANSARCTKPAGDRSSGCTK